MRKCKSLGVLGLFLLFMTGCCLFAGCASNKTKSETKNTTRIITTTTTTETPPQTTTTKRIDRSLNRGHSIREIFDTEHEITRTSDVILSWEDALVFLNDSVKLQNASLEFRLYGYTLEKDILDYQ